jgi:hypothetical protein
VRWLCSLTTLRRLLLDSHTLPPGMLSQSSSSVLISALISPHLSLASASASASLSTSVRSMIRGCSCFRSWSVDQQYSLKYFPSGSVHQTVYSNYNHSKFYRGPYAFATTDWIGSDCSIATCPTGLDPTLSSSRIGPLSCPLSRPLCS